MTVLLSRCRPRTTPRTLTSQLSMTRQQSSSKDWMQRHVNDPYVKQSKTDGVVSRSYYKLEWMDQKCRLLHKYKPNTVVDLGASPGGWTSYCIRRGVYQILSVDLLPLDPSVVSEGRRELGPDGFLMLQGDFTQIRRNDLATDEAPTLVLSDMAPNFTGDKRTDAIRCMALCEQALEFAITSLGKRGAFVSKFFSGPEEQVLTKYAREHFNKVQMVKPPASRSESAEKYFVATEFKGRE